MDDIFEPAAVAVALPQSLLAGHNSNAQDINLEDLASAPVTAQFLRQLLHESGHALHLLLSSRHPSLHACATFCPMDVAEIPSHLFERLLGEPAVVAAMAARPLQPARCRALTARFARGKTALAVYQHAMAAALDLRLHGGGSNAAKDNRTPAAALLAQCLAQQAAQTGVRGATLALASFAAGLLENAGCMYAYVFAELVAAAAYRQHVQAAGGLERGAGMRLRRLLLEPGASLPPQALVEGLLGDGCLAPVGDGWTLNLGHHCFEDLQL